MSTIAADHGLRRVDLAGLRVPGALMLGAGFARGFLAHPPGIPCGLRMLTGIPCPLCGMTTSVTAATHLHLGTAAAANPFGILAVAVALVVVVLPRPLSIHVPAWSMGAALAASWLFELLRFRLL